MDHIGIVVSHTHWDREWYVPFEEFRARLVDTMDELLDILDNNSEYRCFTLDGQMSMVEDYLDIHPEKKSQLVDHVKAGRLHMGPWYILPDQYLVSDEAIVRNLLIGDRMSRDFGTKMPICHMPDIRCQITQMPQIMKGFGLDTGVMGRGVGYQASKSEWYWKGADGTTVLGIYMPRGYSHGLPHDLQDAVKKVGEVVDILAPYATTEYLLFMNGGDHFRPQNFLPRLLDDLNASLEGIELRQGDLMDYVEGIRRRAPELDTLSGEFIYGRPNRICPGVWSSRMYLKQKNNHSQTLLEKYAEPVATFAWLLGNSYPNGLLLKAWKYVIQNHTHDSISACSVDEVHEDMERRNAWADTISERVTRESLTSIVDNIDTVTPPQVVGRLKAEALNSSIVVFNPSNRTRSDWVQVTIKRARKDEPSADHLEYQLFDCNGNTVPCRAVAKGPFDKFYSRTRDQVSLLILEFLAEDIPPFGYSVYHLGEEIVNEACEETDLKEGNAAIGNEFFEVSIVPKTGALSLMDKRTGDCYGGLNVFESVGDRGDEYNFDAVPHDIPISTADIGPSRIVKRVWGMKEQLVIDYKWNLPKSLNQQRTGRSDRMVTCPLTSVITVTRGTPRVDVRTTVNNNAEDHLLEVIVPTGMDVSKYYVEIPFDIVERSVEIPETPEREKWILGQEAYDDFRPQRNFVAVEQKDKGLALLNKGCTNYRIRKSNQGGVDICLTLLRAVGWVSRPDLGSRHGNASPMIKAPGAQCIGTHVFEYSLVPYQGGVHEAGIQQMAHDFNANLVAIETASHEGVLPSKMGFMKITPDDLIITAVKKAEDVNQMIVRCYNPRNESCLGELSAFKSIKNVKFVNLNEEDIPKDEIEGISVTLNDGVVSLCLAPKKICTLRVSFDM